MSSTTIIYTATMLLLLLSAYCMAQDKALNTTPEKCRTAKPRTGNCEVKARRYFLHATRGCKKSGFCEADTQLYDNRDDLNYFISEEDCVQTCMIHVKCPQLEPIPSGSVTNNGEGSWGSSIAYACKEGFTLVGKAERTCLHNSTWTGTPPICKAKCPTPDVSEHVDLNPSQDYYNPGDVVVYTCTSGYDGSARRTCLENGDWSDGEVNCERKIKACPIPGLIQHGREPMAPSLSIGSVVTYSCQDGYTLAGNATRQCTQDLIWSGKEPICWRLTIEVCDRPGHPDAQDITNKTVTIEDGTPNIWFMPHISDPNPFQGIAPEWNLDSFTGIEIHHDKLKISRVLSSTMNNRNFTVTVEQYKAYFNLLVSSIGLPPKKPTVIWNTGQLENSIGDEAQLSCFFEGYPSPNITWLRNKVPVVNTENIIISQELVQPYTTSTLHIHSLTEEDFDIYQCLGTNKLGNDSRLSIIEQNTVSKRSGSLCKSKASSDTVTIVGRIKRQSPKYKSSGITTYKVNIERVISQATQPITRKNIKTIVVSGNQLNTNGLYILQGEIRGNRLFVQDHVFNHSTELEQSLRQC